MKFKYLQDVRFMRGFYEGYQGRATKHSFNFLTPQVTHEDGTSPSGHFYTVTTTNGQRITGVPEADLEVI